MLMPFGKYKGLPVSQLPRGYLLWLWENIELREPLLSAVAEALGIVAPAQSLNLSTVQSVYRRLAMKWHPDRGGTTEAMQAVNEFYEELCNSLAQ